jgi:TolB-like protein/DNA-binding winged helix-turn-helix (wHTH) protein
MDLLFLLVEKRGELVTREEVADRLWGTTVFVDIDQSINTAIRKVRIALHDDPERPRFVETVVGKGYRFAAPVVVNGEGTVSAKAGLPGTPQAAQAGESAAIAAVPAQRMHRRPPVLMLLAGLGAVLAILASGWIAIHVRNTGSSAHSGIKSLVVLPLKNLSGDPGQEYLADGMTEALVSRLSGIHDLRVISRTSSMRLKNSDLSVPEIAKALQVDVVVEGSVIREGNRIRVTAQLIRGTTDEHFWSETYDRELPDVLALQSDVAQAIARKVEVTVSGKEEQRLAASHTVFAGSLRKLFERPLLVK